jgi:predicted nucleotidyltransferase
MFQKLINRLAIGLDQQKIPYMIIGGQAVLLHGEPRLTRDIDITLGVDIDQLHKVQKVVELLQLQSLVATPKQFVADTRVLPVIDPTSNIRIDLVFSFSAFERLAVKRAILIEKDGYKVKYATAEDIVIHKIFAGRPRDLEDVKGILLKNANIDSTYIRKWLQDFSELLDKDLIKKLQTITDEIQ